MPETRIAYWESKRGRQDELEKTGTGTATVLVHDVNGLYDPSNTGSPYYGQLDGVPIALSLRNPVTDTWHTRFQGVIDEYTYDLSSSQRNQDVTLSCVDAFDYLATAEMTPVLHGHELPDGIDAGTVFYNADEVNLRIEKLLNDAQWPIDRRKIFTGNVDIQACVYDAGYSFLAALQDAADAEFPGVANVYVDAVGDVVFHGRKARFDPDTTSNGANWIFTRWNVGDGNAIAGDSSYAQARPPLSSDRSLRLIYNTALIYPSHVNDPDAPEYQTEAEYQETLAGQVYYDTGSINQYGARSFPAAEIRTLRHKTDSTNGWFQAYLMEQYYVDNYSQPRTRPRQITVKSVHPSDHRAAATWAFLCGVEISDIIHLTVTHPGGGGIDEDFYVEGVSTVCRPLQPDFDYVEVTCDVSPAAYWDSNPFTSDV